METLDEYLSYTHDEAFDLPATAGHLRPITIPEPDAAHIHRFVEELIRKYETTNNRDRMHRDSGQHRMNHFVIGKMGEAAAARVLGGRVDLRVWSKGHTFDPDIDGPTLPSIMGWRVHVKTCSARHMRKSTLTALPSASWTADRSDPVRTNPEPDDLIVLMLARPDAVYWLGCVRAVDIVRLWRRCYDRRLTHKAAIYYRDIAPFICPDIRRLQK